MNNRLPSVEKVKCFALVNSDLYLVAELQSALNSGYIWNKTETKQFCFNFISDVVTCEIKQKQNTETILKRFRIVLELFQAH